MKKLLMLFVLSTSFISWAKESVQIKTLVDITIAVDTAKLNEGVLNSELTIPVKQGLNTLCYPRWLPGIHSPHGPIQNISKVIMKTLDGKKVKWWRDPHDPWKFICDIPENILFIKVELEYLSSQGTEMSESVDAHASRDLLVLNWNTLVLYPEAYKDSQVYVKPSLKLNKNWKALSSIPFQRKDNRLSFDKCSLETLIDSPFVAAKKIISKTLMNEPPIKLHFVCDDKEAVYPQELFDEMHKAVKKARDFFGYYPFKSYDFFIVSSDGVSQWELGGLEHKNNTLIILEPYMLDGLKESDFALASVMTHELIHTWCGKFFKPHGMHTENYHNPKDTRLLWVYEGLTECLTHLINVKSGVIDEKAYLENLSSCYREISYNASRYWRSLSDVSSTSFHFGTYRYNTKRTGSMSDVYVEGSMLWFIVDQKIQDLTQGERSIEDFCKHFFAKEKLVSPVVTYDLSTLILSLEAVVDYDWRDFLEKRVLKAPSPLLEDFQSSRDYEVVNIKKKSKERLGMESYHYMIDERDSLGFSLGQEGEIYELVPNSKAFKAGLRTGMVISRIGWSSFSEKSFNKYMRDASKYSFLGLVVSSNGRTETIKIPLDKKPLTYLQLIQKK